MSYVWCCTRTVETSNAKYIKGNEGAVKGYSFLQLPDGYRPKDLSLFHSLTGKNNVILDYYGVWRTHTVSFTHGLVDGDM